MNNKDNQSNHSILLDSCITHSANVEFIKSEIPTVAITLQKPVAFERKGKSFSYVEGDRAIVRADGAYKFVSKSEYQKTLASLQPQPMRAKNVVENSINVRSNPTNTVDEKKDVELYCNPDSHLASNLKRELNKQFIPYSIISFEGIDNKKNLIQIKVPPKFKEYVESITEAIKHDISIDPQSKFYNEKVNVDNDYYKLTNIDARNFFIRQLLDRTTDAEKDPQNLETKQREMHRDAIKKEVTENISACINYCTTIIGMIENHQHDEKSFRSAKSNIVNTIKKTEEKMLEEFKKEPDAPLYFQVRELQLLKAMEKAAENIDTKTPPVKLKERMEKFVNESYYVLLAQSLTQIRESFSYQEAKDLASLAETLPNASLYGKQTKAAKPIVVDTRNASDGLSQASSDVKSDDTKQFADDILDAPYQPKSYAEMLNDYQVPEQEEKIRTLDGSNDTN
jgi:hypothetical protein